MAIRPSLMTIVVLISFLTLVFGDVESKKCIMVNFGDSNSDTGEQVVAEGLLLDARFGQRFDFHQPSTRYSDGRIYLDLLCESLEIPYLSPYLQSLGSDFRHGVNFAYVGAVVENDPSKSKYPLLLQINQFIFFQNFTRLLRSQGKGPMIADEEFGNAIYTIDIGQNDLFWSFVNGTHYSAIETIIISETLKGIESAVKKLYDLGGRKYYLYNTGPLGCLPNMIYGGENVYGGEFDRAGCRTVYNDGSKAFNKGFGMLCDELKSQLKDATIVCVDMYSIKYDLFAHPSKYGFNGAGDVIVDGTHYTEAASQIIATNILSGAYSQPQINLRDLCTR